MSMIKWDNRNRRLWNHIPVKVRHDLSDMHILSMDYLANLIDMYKRMPDKYTLVHMGRQGGRKSWLEGKISVNMTGKQVIEMIHNERLWINLLHVNEWDLPHQYLLDALYGEIGKNTDTDKTFKHLSGILISSPGAQVYYHFDTTGQSLWQIHGSKRVRVWPACLPFLTQHELREVTIYRNEVGVSYEPWYDEHAYDFSLQSGEMLHWPLNSPHRIENGDELSVSLTTEYYTWPIRKHVWDMGFEGLTHIDSGWVPLPIKAGVVAIAQRTGLLNRKREQKSMFILPQLPA